MINTVTKRSGEVVPFDHDKLNSWAIWSADNCEGVYWSDVIFKAVRTLHEEVSTADLHQSLIDACLTYRTEGHTKMAARLLAGLIYKEAFDDFSVPHLADYYQEMVDSGLWRDMDYSVDELNELDSIIDHTLDFTYSYASLKQLADKYLTKSYGKLTESPQMAFMGIAMSNMSEEKDKIRDVTSAYKAISETKINLPTPTVILERTPMTTSPSCCVISANDSVESIAVANHIAYTFTAKSSGIGVELRTRAPKDPVKDGKISHGGKHGYYSMVDRAVKANQQQSRGGSATVTFHALDPEILSLLTLKQQRTDPTYRIDSLDYSFAVNNLFLRKVAKNEDWMVVSTYYANKLWDLSYSGDEEAFEQEYNRVLSSGVKKSLIPARDIINAWIKARGDTGRVYLTFLDNINQHTPFKDSIKLSNLCQEVMLPTGGFDHMSHLYTTEADTDAEIALCSLGSIVVSNIKDDEEYKEISYILAKIIDNTLEKGVYPFPHVEATAKARRSIGIGMTDVAHLIAQGGLRYDTQDGRNFIHRLAERHSYYLHLASIDLAKERGKCSWFEKTKYSDDNPWIPLDTYKKGVDDYHTQGLMYNWKGIKEGIKQYGVRFSVLESYMPTESSSLITNSTNSVYPIRRKEIFKSSRKGMVYFRAPEMDTLDYQYAWDINSLDMVKVYAIIQKFTGQGISADFYSKLDGEETKLSVKETIQQILLAAKTGMKSFYYQNFLTGADEEVEKEEEGGCESCKL